MTILLFAMTALAQDVGYSADIELLRHRFGAGGIPGVEEARSHGQGSVRTGLMLQYQRDPLTLYDAVADVERGAIVTNRTAFALGLSADLTDRFSVSGVLPGARSLGAEVPEFGGDATGLGDIGAGAQWVGLRTKALGVGLRGDLRLPTGRSNAWLGERGVRATGALLASVDLGPLGLASDVGLQGRTTLATSEDFVLGPELQGNLGARLALPAATRLAITGALLSRTAVQAPFSGGAEDAVEAMAGLQVKPGRAATLDLGAGRGLTEGYGTTDLRLVSILTLRNVRRGEPAGPRPAPPRPPVAGPLPVSPDVFIEELDFGERTAIVVKNRIVIQQQPQFVVDTDVLLDSSRPILADVAELLVARADVGHVIIEGHASQEGDHAHNYDLSMRRAHTIWRELLLLGVDGKRLSFRPMGEVEPVAAGSSEEALQRNRRVEFHITQWLEDDSAPPRRMQPVPWTGGLTGVVEPLEAPE